MMNPGKGIIQTVMYPVIILFLVIFSTIFFGIKETQRAAILSSDYFILQQVMKVSEESLIRFDIFSVNRNLRALVGDKMQVRIIFENGYEIFHPKDYFKNLDRKKSVIDFKYQLPTGQFVYVEAWPNVTKSSFVFYSAYFVMGIVGLIVFFIALYNIKRWERDLTATALFLYQQDEKLDKVKLNFSFFHRIVEMVTEKKNMEVENLEKETRLQLQEGFAKLAAQVSHDIRSPLSALNMLLGQIKNIPENQRLIIRNAVNRINDIANTLLIKAKGQKTPHIITTTSANRDVSMAVQIELLPALVDTLVSEKRVQFRDKIGVEIEADLYASYGAFAEVNITEFSRVLSNLTNNAVEAFPEGRGKFTLSVRKYQNHVVVVAKDNGKGIPKHILEKLGQMGVTHGKEDTQSGSGLGVYHAKKTVESFGGKFEIHSQEGLGSMITITLPASTAPAWFVKNMILQPNSHVVSLDDDLSIHGIWKGRLESTIIHEFGIEHLTFTSGEEFKDWVLNNKKAESLFLVDYELLNQKQTGLEIIEELGIGHKSILVTSRYEESQIRERCQKLGVRLIPKGMAGLVPIGFEKSVKSEVLT